MLFSTGYDPLDLASDSVDPLGFLRGYLALADRLLPRFYDCDERTPLLADALCRKCVPLRGCILVARITNQPKRADGAWRFSGTSRKFGRLPAGWRRRPAASQPLLVLRGIRYVRRFLEANAPHSEINVGDFNLLANQVRYGGIGTYGQMLEACHFADWTVLTLHPPGGRNSTTPQIPGSLRLLSCSFLWLFRTLFPWLPAQ
jgi:hypothetical protein